MYVEPNVFVVASDTNALAPFPTILALGNGCAGVEYTVVLDIGQLNTPDIPVNVTKLKPLLLFGTPILNTPPGVLLVIVAPESHEEIKAVETVFLFGDPVTNPLNERTNN